MGNIYTLYIFTSAPTRWLRNSGLFVSDGSRNQGYSQLDRVGMPRQLSMSGDTNQIIEGSTLDAKEIQDA